MNALAVIPARYPSTRLPAKPLKLIGERTLLQRVYEQAKKARSLSRVVIATDDDRIVDAARSFGAEVLKTSDTLLTGSDRVAETASILASQGHRYDLIANVQGDMPFINPEVIDRTVYALAESDQVFGMSTVATPLLSEGEFLRPSAVKVVVGADGGALYFSRAPIPFIREPKEVTISEETPWGFKHMGLYVFRPDTLNRLSSLAQSLPETREKLEQLRALSNGIRIKVCVVPPALVSPAVEVDTPEDLERARALCEEFDRRG